MTYPQRYGHNKETEPAVVHLSLRGKERDGPDIHIQLQVVVVVVYHVTIVAIGHGLLMKYQGAPD